MFLVSFCCDALRDLVTLVQFKKREKRPWRSVNFSKVAGFIRRLQQNQIKVHGVFKKLEFWKKILDEWTPIKLQKCSFFFLSFCAYKRIVFYSLLANFVTFGRVCIFFKTLVWQGSISGEFQVLEVIKIISLPEGLRHFSFSGLLFSFSSEDVCSTLYYPFYHHGVHKTKEWVTSNSLINIYCSKHIFKYFEIVPFVLLLAV